MDFLDKLYESNYFGIGLFAVISFLVVTFLIVLFFGKRDEKRRLDSSKELEKEKTGNTFKETSVAVPIETPVQPVPIMTDNVMPVIEETTNLGNIDSKPMDIEEKTVLPIVNEETVAPINYREEPIKPVIPVGYENSVIYEPKHIDQVSNEEKNLEISPIIEETPTPIITEQYKKVEPIRLEPTTYDMPIEPKTIEPIRITIPEESVKTEPVKPVINPVISEETPKIVEPSVTDMYYKPIPKVESEEVEVPSIDFDALAKSISDELDELESSSNDNYEGVKVTPINEVVSKPSTQFSSVYVSEPTKVVEKETIDLPKKIDLPTMKTDDIEPENYNI